MSEKSRVNYKLFLELEFYIGCNPGDFCGDSDFEGLNLSHFDAYRNKMMKKSCIVFERERKKGFSRGTLEMIKCIFSDAYYQVLEDYCTNHKDAQGNPDPISRNKPIFPVSESAVSQVFKLAVERAGLNIGDIHEQIRRLNGTILSMALAEAKEELFKQKIYIREEAIQNCWTGHALSISDKHYIQSHFPHLLAALPFIEKHLRLHGAAFYKKQLDTVENKFVEEMRRAKLEMSTELADIRAQFKATVEMVIAWGGHSDPEKSDSTPA